MPTLIDRFTLPTVFGSNRMSTVKENFVIMPKVPWRSLQMKTLLCYCMC